jgi:hypothetical protein
MTIESPNIPRDELHDADGEGRGGKLLEIRGI